MAKEHPERFVHMQDCPNDLSVMAGQAVVPGASSPQAQTMPRTKDGFRRKPLRSSGTEDTDESNEEQSRSPAKWTRIASSPGIVEVTRQNQLGQGAEGDSEESSIARNDSETQLSLDDSPAGNV